jgi:serine/threonine protein kinase
LGDHISEGAYGYVCKASNTESNEKIAIKFFKKQNDDKTIKQEIKVGCDEHLICSYIMTFKNQFTFSNKDTDGEFMCVSMELMDYSLNLLKPSEKKESIFPLLTLFTVDTKVLFILFICSFNYRQFYTFFHKFYLVLGCFILTI